MNNNRMSPSSEDMSWALLQITLRVTWALYQKCIVRFGKKIAKLPVATKELIFRDLQLTYQWERTEKIDREMLAHMSAMHRSWHSKQKQKDLICMAVIRIDLSFSRWVDAKTYQTAEAMTQMIAPSSDVDVESHTPATPEDAFISVMGKDRLGCVHCAGSGETLSTWYRSIGTSASLERERIMQEQLKAQEEKLKAQEEEMTQMREKISRLENVASKVDEMSILLSQIQAS
ncbi:hypothetical protein Taro_001487 [Colocasia esculenta]|uniref:Uncharacterized protein n=1 Tax=Colocasia esculenta TaxID=4460 RepID=A0A843TEU3_COLES|nr:hypothetical protein [Colocasia esculenta]